MIRIFYMKSRFFHSVSYILAVKKGQFGLKESDLLLLLLLLRINLYASSVLIPTVSQFRYSHTYCSVLILRVDLTPHRGTLTCILEHCVLRNPLLTGVGGGRACFFRFG